MVKLGQGGVLLLLLLTIGLTACSDTTNRTINGSPAPTANGLSLKTSSPALVGQSGPVYALAVSKDGQTLATASQNSIILWSLPTGQPRQTLYTHAAYIANLAISPDNQTLASLDVQGQLTLWSVSQGQRLAQLTAHSGGGNGLAFSPDGKTLATGGNDNYVKLWDVATRKDLTLRGHSAGVLAVAFSPNGQQLASTGLDASVRLWNVASALPDGTLEQEASVSGGYRSLTYSPDGQTLAAGLLYNREKSIQLWDVASRKPKTELTGLVSPIFSMAYSPDGRSLLAVGGENKARIWQAEGGPVQTTLDLGDQNDNLGYVASFTSDGQTLVIGTTNGTLQLWNPTSAQLIRRLPAHRETAQTLSYTADGKSLLTISVGGKLKFWDTTNAQNTDTLDIASQNKILSPPSADGSTMALLNNDQLALWNIADRRAAPPVKLELDKAIGSLVLSQDGKLAFGGQAFAYSAPGVYEWDASTGKVTATFATTAAIYSLVVSPDGKTLALAGAVRAESGAESYTVELWDIASQTKLRELKGSNVPPLKLVFSPDGASLAAGYQDGSVKFWQLDQELPLATLTDHSGPINGLVWSKDSKTLFSTASDDRLIGWEVAGKQIKYSTQAEQTPGLQNLAIAPDGQTLATAHLDGSLKFWRIG